MPARKTTNMVKRKCLMCKKEFEIPEYYINIHGDRKFCSNNCFKRYRQLKGLVDAASKNKNRIHKLVGF